MAEKILEIQANQYQSEVLDKPLAVLDFYSTECPPCEALAAKYEALSEIYGDDVHFVKIFRQGNRELAQELGVTSSPTLIFYRNGEEVGKRVSGGIKRSEVQENLELLVGEARAKELASAIKPYTTHTDVIVLGGGPAGLTAGTYLAQARIPVILVDTALPGGYVATTHQVSNYPGFIEPQPGMMLAHYMSEQAKENGVELRAAAEVNSVDLKNHSVTIDGVETIVAKRIIVATGSTPRPLGIAGEGEYRGNGLSYCATCDAKYFDGKHVIVIGGGNSAIEEALFIRKFAAKLTIIHQFDEFQANKVAQEKILSDENVEVLFSHEPRKFIKNGPEDMTVEAENLKTGETVSVQAAGVFIFVGFIPNLNGMDGFEVDQWGYLKTDGEMRTSIDGVYAAGDIVSKNYRQITTAVSDGTIAAISISKELSE